MAVGRRSEAVIQLRRSQSQRAYGWMMAVLGGTLVIGMPVLAVGPWTYFSEDAGAGKWFLLAITPWFTLLMARTAAAAFRLATLPSGRVRLEADALVIEDGTVFREPLRLHRSEIASIEPAPSGRLDYGWWSDARREDAGLVSAPAERPNVLIRFKEPQVLRAARPRHALQANYALRSPTPRKALRGLWLRTADDIDPQRLIDWLRLTG